MENYNKGLNFDLNGNCKKAIEYYTISIDNGENIEKAYLNLIVILIEISFDYGSSSYLINNQILTEEEISKLFIYLEKIVNEAKIKFPHTNEIIFWEYYYKNYYNEFDRNQLLEIIEKQEENLIPYFYLYMNDLSNNIPYNHYIDKILRLKSVLNHECTFKNKYIKSFIESSEQNFER